MKTDRVSAADVRGLAVSTLDLHIILYLFVCVGACARAGRCMVCGLQDLVDRTRGPESGPVRERTRAGQD
jgi:hypothetical protein